MQWFYKIRRGLSNPDILEMYLYALHIKYVLELKQELEAWIEQ
jgi:hypothetical protein